MRHPCQFVRSALLGGAVGWGLLACQQAVTSQRPPRAATTAAVPTARAAEAPRPSLEVAPGAAPAVAAREPEPEALISSEPKLFVRLGDALMPLGCKRGELWLELEACVEADGAEQVTLHPRLLGEPGLRSASPASVPFLLSGASEQGLLLVEVERGGSEAERPFLGFGIARSPAAVRFARAAARAISDEAASWCQEAEAECEGVDEAARVELAPRHWRAEERREALALVRQATASLGDPLGIEVSAGFDVSVAGRDQRLLMVEVDTGNMPVEKAAKLDLPGRLHYLLAKTPVGLRQLNVVREYDLGLGEAGELVGAVDLDHDGTDELILEWRYSEGRSWQLVRRDGEQLVVVGSFTDGA